MKEQQAKTSLRSPARPAPARRRPGPRAGARAGPQPDAGAEGDRVRLSARALLRAQIAAAFGDGPRSPVTGQLARFALAAFGGAFLASQNDRGVTLERLLQLLVPPLAASRRELLAGATAPVDLAGAISGAPGTP